MKKFLLIIIAFCLYTLPLVLYLKLVLDIEISGQKARVEKVENQKHFEQLEKEIRLLKQDYLILENGFTEEEG